MTGTTDEADVVIVGGGVAGCGIARELAADHDVVLVEQGQIAAEASALAAGIVGLSATYSHVPAVAEYAAEFFESYDGTREFDLTRRGSVGPVLPDREAEARNEADHLASKGLAVAYLESDEISERHPRLAASRFAGAVEFGPEPGQGWVDPYTFAVELKNDAEIRGADIRTHTPAETVLVEEGRVRGVETATGRIEGSAVVVATGWWTPRLLEDVIELPIRPYRTQIIVLDPGEDVSDMSMGHLPERHVYWRPENNGDLLVGGWSFPTDDPSGASRDEDEAFRDHVAEVVPEIFVGMDNAGFVDGWAGVESASPDTYPIIDVPDDAPDGLVIATGFNGRGVMTAPVTGAAGRALVTGEPPPFPLEPFRLDRFDSRSPDFEFKSISSNR